MQQPVAIRRRAALVTGYGVSVAMWGIGYIAMLGWGSGVGDVLALLMLACHAIGGVVLGRAGGSMLDGAIAGFATWAINVLIIGSLIGGDAWWWLPATLGIAVGLSCAGLIAGRLVPGAPGLLIEHPLALLTRLAVVAVFSLVLTGGLVTSWEAGLAVPDYPSSFGHNMVLYPFFEMVSATSRAGGVHFEHAHRLYGMLVGLTAIILTVAIWRSNRPRLVFFAAATLLLLVIVQGLLGGFRVTEVSVLLATLHGVLAQVVFSLFGLLALWTSPSWVRLDARERGDISSTDRSWSILLIGILLVQLALGAAYRHTNPDPVMWAKHGHITFSAIATLAVLFTAIRAWGMYAPGSPVARLAKALLHSVSLQVILGIVAWALVSSRPPTDPTIPFGEVAIATAHQANGALLLLLACLLAAWVRRMPRAAAESTIAPHMSPA